MWNVGITARTYSRSATTFPTIVSGIDSSVSGTAASFEPWLSGNGLLLRVALDRGPGDLDHLGADSAARCVLLPEPERRTYRTATGEPVQLWVVLEPEGAREVVVFDEATSSFGLTRAGVFLGPVGRFREAVACVSLPDAR